MRKATDKTLKQFYKVLFKSKESQSSNWVGTVVLIVVMIFLSIDPIINDLESVKGSLLTFFVGCVIGWSYIRVYMIYGEKEKETFDLLRLHAISGKEIRAFWCKKLAVFYGCFMLPISLLGCLYRYFILEQEINLIWTVLNADVLPFLLLTSMLFTKKKKYSKGWDVLKRTLALLIKIGIYVSLFLRFTNL